MVTSATEQRKNADSDPSQRLDVQRTSAEEFRDAAIALDRVFMQTVAKRNQRPKNMAGLEASKSAWKRQAASVRREMRHLKDAKKGTLEWEEKQRLLSTLRDAPRE